MTNNNSKTLYSLALSFLNQTSPYSRPVEDFKYTFINDVGEEEIKDFCKMLKQFLGNKKVESGHANSDMKNFRKIIENIDMAMCEYIDDYPGAYSVVQHHRNLFGIWFSRIVNKFGHGIEYGLPEKLQYENENQNTVVLLLKELQNRNGVTKEELEKRLGLKKRQIAKDLRKLDNTLIDSREIADMSDYVPFRIGGQPVQVKITAERNKENPGDRTLRYKTVNSLHPIILQENLMQTATLIQALSRNFHEENSNISLFIATDIWYQLSLYARSRIKWLFDHDDDVKVFISYIEDDCPTDSRNPFMTERNLLREADLTNEDLLMYFVKVPDRRCNITIRGADGESHKIYDQSISVGQSSEGQIIYTATGRDGETVSFLKDDFLGIEEYSNHR